MNVLNASRFIFIIFMYLITTSTHAAAPAPAPDSILVPDAPKESINLEDEKGAASKEKTDMPREQSEGKREHKKRTHPIQQK